MDIHRISPTKAMMLTGSDSTNGKRILGAGGDASVSNIKDAGAKRRNGIFEDSEPEGSIW